MYKVNKYLNFRGFFHTGKEKNITTIKLIGIITSLTYCFSCFFRMSEDREKIRRDQVKLIQALLISAKGGVPLEKLNSKTSFEFYFTYIRKYT